MRSISTVSYFIMRTSLMKEKHVVGENVASVLVCNRGSKFCRSEVRALSLLTLDFYIAIGY